MIDDEEWEWRMKNEEDEEWESCRTIRFTYQNGKMSEESKNCKKRRVNQIIVEGTTQAEWDFNTILNCYRGKWDDLVRENYKSETFKD